MKNAHRCLWALVGMLAVLLAADAPKSAAQAPVVLKAVTAWDKNAPFVDMYMAWIKRVNDKARGKLRIDYLGGPEVYPSFEQLDPLKRGVIDTIVTSTAYVAGALPELNATWFGFGASPEQMRNSGLVDQLDKVLREKAQVTLTGMPLQMQFNLFLIKPIDRADLKGLKLRSTPIYDPVLKALGAATATLPPAEILTALQTGVVDGLAWPATFVTGPGYARVVRFKVTPPWWIGTDVALMNAKSFDALAPDLRKLLVDTMREVEREVPGYYLNREKQEDAALERAGVKVIELPPADMDRIRRIHWEEGTKAFLLNPSPKYGPPLRDLMARFAPR